MSVRRASRGGHNGGRKKAAAKGCAAGTPSAARRRPTTNCFTSPLSLKEKRRKKRKIARTHEPEDAEERPRRNETKRNGKNEEKKRKGREEREKEGRSPPPKTLEADSTVDWRARLGLVFACPRRQARPRTTTHDRPISHGRTRPADGNRQCAIQTAASFCSEPFETSLRRKERKKERKKITYPKRIAKQQGARWRAN